MIPDWKLERYLTGDLPEGEMREIRELEKTDEIFAHRVKRPGRGDEFFRDGIRGSRDLLVLGPELGRGLLRPPALRRIPPRPLPRKSGLCREFLYLLSGGQT